MSDMCVEYRHMPSDDVVWFMVDSHGQRKNVFKVDGIQMVCQWRREVRKQQLLLCGYHATSKR